MDALIHSNSFGIADTGMLYTPTNPLLLQNSDQSFDMAGSGHSSHPDFGHLVLLVFEAVMEVVCVSLPGYIVARMGMFDSNSQKFVANLNITLFTPCLSKHSPFEASLPTYLPKQSSRSLQASCQEINFSIWASYQSYLLSKPLYLGPALSS